MQGSPTQKSKGFSHDNPQNPGGHLHWCVDIVF